MSPNFQQDEAVVISAIGAWVLRASTPQLIAAVLLRSVSWAASRGILDCQGWVMWPYLDLSRYCLLVQDRVGLRLWPSLRTGIPDGLSDYLWGSALDRLEKIVSVFGSEGRGVLDVLVPPMIQQSLSAAKSAVPDDVLPWRLRLVSLRRFWAVYVIELFFDSGPTL